MKTAINAEGKAVRATPWAPPEALCPYCGGKTILRRRRRMAQRRVTYFWRHQDNRNLRCPGRAGTPKM